jgi:hypothetical protein
MHNLHREPGKHKGIRERGYSEKSDLAFSRPLKG